jgi:tripartite-type tricarboxylate transporter receptor subunit TctC
MGLPNYFAAPAASRGENVTRARQPGRSHGELMLNMLQCPQSAPSVIEHMTRLLACLTALAIAAAPSTAHAQPSPAGWPAKPVRFIVPFPAGSASDTAARLVGQALTTTLGQQLVIDNRAGASGNIGVDLAAHAPPDGYTLVLGTASTHALAPTLNAHLTYDPIRDFAPISLIGDAPYVLVVHESVPAKNVRELIALAKARPGTLNYASAGQASLAHLAGELFASMAAIQLVHVPYKSSAQAVLDIAAGRIEMQFGTIAPTLPYIRNGQLRALGLTSSERVASLPDVGTIAQSGLPGYEASLWFGILAPAGTPTPIVRRLNRDLIKLLGSGDVREALIAQGIEPIASTPDAFGQRIRDDLDKWRKIVSAAGIKED